MSSRSGPVTFSRPVRHVANPDGRSRGPSGARGRGILKGVSALSGLYLMKELLSQSKSLMDQNAALTTKRIVGDHEETVS